MTDLIPRAVWCHSCGSRVTAPPISQAGTWPFVCPKCGRIFALVTHWISKRDLSGQIQQAI
jgi:predicted RNA-binding Zn-ribbon protein involved in translation (DUF1610 family)